MDIKEVFPGIEHRVSNDTQPMHIEIVHLAHFALPVLIETISEELLVKQIFL